METYLPKLPFSAQAHFVPSCGFCYSSSVTHALSQGPIFLNIGTRRYIVQDQTRLFPFDQRNVLHAKCSLVILLLVFGSQVAFPSRTLGANRLSRCRFMHHKDIQGRKRRKQQIPPRFQRSTSGSITRTSELGLHQCFLDGVCHVPAYKLSFILFSSHAMTFHVHIHTNFTF